MKTSRKDPQSIDSQIVAAIVRRGRGTVFVPAEFLELGSRETVDIVLHRLARKGTIRRLARGVYDFPKEHPALGPLLPSADAVANALAGRDRTRLQPAGAYAANALGLTEQVPPNGGLSYGMSLAPLNASIFYVVQKKQYKL